ncbi:MAG: hypothetical protein A2X86_11490 [Bdellovibrionales bacterium GWA2_49_15]|nr:MAG: hypothetical protein A2X86_11490 [Bdellovibrionales bacterium GWA2_49_15]HAZ12626.1 hypothetical protein [Bdellovibrionales bacterium]
MCKYLITLCSLIFALQAAADQPTLSNVTQGQLDGIYKDLGSIMYPTTVSGASSLGKIFGFEIGVLGGVADSPHIDALVPENVSRLPKAGLMGIVTVPFGLGIEASILPVTVGDFEYDYMSIGGRWTINEVISAIPFIDLKLKVDFTKAELKWKQTISNVPVNVTYENKSTAYSLTVGKKILFIEPFAGLGRIDGKSSLTSTGTVSIFDVSVPLSAREDVSQSDTYYFLGCQLHLLFLNLGAELAKVYDNQVVVGKLSFGF